MNFFVLFNPALNYQIDITANQLKQFVAKVLIINGDRDEFARIADAIEMHTHIPYSSLWIIPRISHVAIDPSNEKEFVKYTKAFFSS